MAGAVVLGAGVVAGGWYLQQQANGQLRAEVALLRTEVQALARHREQVRKDEGRATVASDLSQTAQQQADRAELERLREELNTVKARTQEIAQAAQAVRAAVAAGKSPADAVPVKLVPVHEWRNAGRATPGATVETVLWAAVGGDIDTLAETLEFTASAREKATALFNRLPEETRGQYGTPEKLIALMIAKDADKVAGMQVLGEREVSPGNVGMRIRFGNEQGQTKEDTFLMHRAADGGWRLMLPDAPVEKFAKQLRAGGGK